MSKSNNKVVETTKPRFNVGDKVKVITNEGGGRKGDILTIANVLSSYQKNGTWFYRFVEITIGLYEHRLELVKENKMQVDKIYYNTSSDKYYKLLAIISGQGYLFQRFSHLTGKLYEGQGKKMFIPNEEFVQARWKEYTPKQSGTVWVNVYGNVGRLSAVAHNSKEVANEEAGKNRLACVKVDWVEGQGL